MGFDIVSTRNELALQKGSSESLSNRVRKECSQYCEIELLTAGTENAKKTVNISDIYVDLLCVPYPYQEGVEAKPCLLQFGSFDQNVVILGMPGCGKSTLIKRLYSECLQSSFENNQGIYNIPVFIELKNEFTTNRSRFCEISSSDNLGRGLKSYVFNKINELTSAGTLGEQLSKNIQEDDAQIRYYIFCDGLDEISIEQSVLFNKTVVELAHFSYVKFYISSRYQGFKLDDYGDDTFSKYSLREFGLNQEKEYVEKFFALAGEFQSDNKEIILSALSRDSNLQEIAKSPILLSLLCISNDIKSVKDRTELFDRAINALLHHRGIIGSKAESTRQFLQNVAVSFFKQDRLEKFEIEEVSFYLKDSEAYLKCGLFDEDKDNNIKFYHRTIWEYLVAQGMSGDQHCNEIYERANMTAWAVPIRMWVIMYTKRHTSAETYNMFCELWKRNKALTLECLSEYPNSSEVLNKLYKSMNKKQKLRLISTLRDSYINAPDYKEQAVSTIEKSLRLIHNIEKHDGKDCEVIYEYVSFLEEFNNEPRFIELLDEILEYDTLNDRLAKLTDAGLRFIQIKAGCFEMGRNKFIVPADNDKKKYISIDEEEIPRHKVRITRDFEMSQTLITNEMFYLCGFPYASSTHNYDASLQKFRNSYCGERGHPVNYVTWYEAMIFSKWLKCTLPTEAEWEYACRGYGNADGKNDDAFCIVEEQDKLREYLRGGQGNDNDYPIMRAHYSYAGNTTMPRLVFEGAQRNISTDDIRCNNLGLVDMLGNLREWCLDWFGEDFYKKCDVSSYPTFQYVIEGKDSVTFYFNEKNEICILKEGEHVDADTFTFDKNGYCVDPVKRYVELTESKCIRGGCFDWNVTNLRPTYRNHNPATNVYKVNGFRIVRKIY